MLYRLSYPVSEQFRLRDRAGRVQTGGESRGPVLARESSAAGQWGHVAIGRGDLHHSSTKDHRPWLSSASSPTTSPRIGTSPRSSSGSRRSVRGRRAADDHAHKVEVNLTKAQREEVRKRFEDSPVELAGLGSAFEYQATDPAVVRKNIEGTKEYVRLAHDIGAPGVKVRPNGIPKGADLDATLRQIGRALHEVGEDAADFGVEIRVEVHGGVTQELRRTSPRSSEYADHPNVYACWNSNPTDVKNGTIKETFALVGR